MGGTMDTGISRRALGTLAAGAALAATASCGPEPHKPLSRQFPKDFIWGAATSAFQIEGALDVDGRGPSIWDVFENDPKHIIDHSTAAIAADSIAATRTTWRCSKARTSAPIASRFRGRV